MDLMMRELILPKAFQKLINTCLSSCTRWIWNYCMIVHQAILCSYDHPMVQHWFIRMKGDFLLFLTICSVTLVHGKVGEGSNVCMYVCKVFEQCSEQWRWLSWNLSCKQFQITTSQVISGWKMQSLHQWQSQWPEARVRGGFRWWQGPLHCMFRGVW